MKTEIWYGSYGNKWCIRASSGNQTYCGFFVTRPTSRQQRAFKKWAYGRFNAWRALC